MQSDPSTIVESWFAEHEDGEFSQTRRAVPYLIIGPNEETRTTLFATKPMLVSAAMHAGTGLDTLSLIGRYGLPSESDLGWIAPLIATPELWFLGDLDPPDLMIFVWLRHHLAPLPVRYVGISDAFLEASAAASPESAAIPLSASERRALEILPAVLPDFEKIVGPHCLGMLESGYKMEVEAIMTDTQPPGLSLYSALLQLL